MGPTLAQTDWLGSSGPITVTADEAEWQEGSRMRYRGNVRMSATDYALGGDVLELDQGAEGVSARLEGRPARLEHAAAPGGRGQATLPVSASARSLRYDAASGWVDLEGEARLTRGPDEITGERIRYNLVERRVQASGARPGEQVRIVITPPSPTPAPAP